MTAFPKILIMLVLWLLYTFLVWRGCNEELCTNCGKAAVTDVIPTDTGTVAARRYPIDFQWSNATPFTNVGFDSLKQGIAAKGTPNGILEITGLYFESEPKPRGYDNMGFARADRVKALFADRADSIILKARLLEEPEGARTGYFEGALFDWLARTREAPQTVQELADRIIIRFPFGSLEKEYDPAVDDYLDKLATQVKASGETVTLTGHTDNVGNDAGNLSFGKRRADSIKAVLVQKGVKAEQITTDSKGETQPVSSNTTNEGRHENRRVEVRLVKRDL